MVSITSKALSDNIDMRADSIVQLNKWYHDTESSLKRTTIEVKESCFEYVLMQDDHGYDYLSMCEWSMSSALVQEYGIAIDLQFTLPEKHHPGSLPADIESQALVPGRAWSPLKDDLIAYAKAARGIVAHDIRTVRIILPTKSGYVAQADWIQRRLIDCETVERAVCFLSPRTPVEASSTSLLDNSLRDLMEAACAGLLLAPTATIDEVNTELAGRLTSAWILPEATIPRYRLAVVDGRRHKFASSAGEGIYRAAAGLDIGLVVLDKAGHWLQSPDEKHLCDELLPVDIAVDDGLVDRIVTAIRNLTLGVDGIVTWTDAYLLPVAEAAALLGLPGFPAQSIASCVDKSFTRLLPCNPTPCQSYHFSNHDELEAAIAEHGVAMRFPIVLKPCSGTSSEGVFKIHNFEELRAMAMRNLHSSSIGGKYGRKMLLETYIDGPEVDVNMTLLDGRVVFSEISDDFPSPADSEWSDMTSTFADTANAMPSALPQEEQQMLVETCRRMLLDMDIRSGIFHFEARVTNSSMEYTTHDGLLDLYPVPHERRSSSKPGCFVIEINARMPGNMGSGLIERLWGIDYYSLYMLFAVKDSARVRALATPYTGGAQYHAQVLRLSASKGGVWASADPCRKLLDEAPELRKNVVHYRNLYQRGMMVPDPVQGVVVCVAFLYIVSRESREEMLWASQKVAELFDYEVEGCKRSTSGSCVSRL
ncbi:hypothetical protein LTR17_002445 [Elasticomyces elasticus]|nr:hypothetical protein LTR17_002445 [Elasticomyces elasticus]